MYYVILCSMYYVILVCTTKVIINLQKTQGLCCEPMITWDWGEDQLCRFQPLYFQPLRLWSPWLGSAQPLSQKWPQSFSLSHAESIKGLKVITITKRKGLQYCYKTKLSVYLHLTPWNLSVLVHMCSSDQILAVILNPCLI